MDIRTQSPLGRIAVEIRLMIFENRLPPPHHKTTPYPATSTIPGHTGVRVGGYQAGALRPVILRCCKLFCEEGRPMLYEKTVIFGYCTTVHRFNGRLL